MGTLQEYSVLILQSNLKRRRGIKASECQPESEWAARGENCLIWNVASVFSTTEIDFFDIVIIGNNKQTYILL